MKSNKLHVVVALSREGQTGERYSLSSDASPADNSAMEKNLAEKAAKLKQAWVLLVARETPHAPDFKTHEKIQEKRAALKASMVELLMIVQVGVLAPVGAKKEL